MKIVLYGINFSPEITGIGKYTGEMAQWLSEHGHEITVVTAPPYYPAWKVSAPYSAGSFVTEKQGDITIYRCPVWVPAQPGGLKRLLHLASFSASSAVRLVMLMWGHRPDAIFVVAPSLMCAPMAWVYAQGTGAKSWLHIQDYEVDAAFDMGLIKGEAARRRVTAVERWLLRKFDRVSTISGRMMARAVAKGVDSTRVVSFPNWVDVSAITPLTGPSPYRAELGIAPETVVALYSGNMGNKQGLEILAESASLMRADADVQFVFCGDGSGKAALQKLCESLPNVRFLPLQPLERLNDLLGLADIHLLPQRADAADLVMPSKLTGMLASGRPVVATAAPTTELGQVVQQAAQCGLAVPPGDAKAFADAIRQLASNSALREAAGVSGRSYAERELDRDAVMRRFEQDLKACVQAG